MKTITQANLQKGQKVLVRCDLDVPIENGSIQEEFRLKSCLPTLKYIIEEGAYPIICGHVGKPEGKYVENLSTKHLLPFFEENLGEGKFELLENLRFDPREEENADSLAQELAHKATIFVNESFATCHRKHTSIVGIPKYLDSYAGLQLEKEMETVQRLMENPKRPLLVIVGGTKLESKLPVVSKFLDLADWVFIGSKLALEWNKEVPSNLILPSDYASENKDIGNASIEYIRKFIQQAQTIVWAGPVGMYEDELFEKGTKMIAQAIAEETRKGAYSIVGGGDTTAALDKFGLLNQISFASTGGSALLTFIAEGTLLGLEALNQKFYE